MKQQTIEKDSLGDRMKRYENVYRYKLTPKSPLIIRLDGKAFHTYTKGRSKPFDEPLMFSMIKSAVYVAKHLQGFKAAYVQSDEASFLITDYDKLESEGWFGYELNKIVSITAAMMTAKFVTTDLQGLKKCPVFDSRCFTIPKEDISNYFLWRAKDWGRNSIQMLAQVHFSAKELHKKKTPDLHEMLHTKGINWNDESDQIKNGTFISKDLLVRHDILPNFTSINDFINSNLNQL